MKRMILVSLLLAGFSTASANPLTYEVQPGDSLASILRSLDYGTEYAELLPFIEQVLRANPDAFKDGNANFIYPDSTLLLPENPNTPEPQPEPEPEPEPAPEPAPEPEPEPEPAPQIPTIGQLEASVGQTEIRREDTTLPVSFREDLQEGDLIVTGSDSVAEIRLADGSLFVLGPDSEFEVERFEFKPQQNGDALGRLLAKLHLGVMRAVTGLLSSGSASDFEVRSVMNSTIGVRGTDFTVRACTDSQLCGDLFGASVAVQEGGISLANQSGEVVLAEGEFAQVQSPAALPKKAPLPEGFFELGRKISDIEVDQPWWQRAKETVESWF